MDVLNPQKAVNQATQLSRQSLSILAQLNPLSKGLAFDQQLAEAMSGLQNIGQTNEFKILKKKRENTTSEVQGADWITTEPFAQVGGGVAENAAQMNVGASKVPLQMFLDKAVLALNTISRSEFKMNDLIKEFVAGKISEEHVILETAKFNLAISMITTILQSAIQAFKEIQQIPV